MTLTYPVLDRARELVWLVTGESKVEPLQLLLAGDPRIPAGRVRAERSLVIADRAAAGSG
jgi:6-phosphogluconolactonase